MDKSKYGRRLSLKDKETILYLFQKGMPCYNIAKSIGFDAKVVKMFLEKKNIYETRHHRTYNCDQEFFDIINTEIKAYWLGFIAADGCIKNKNHLSLVLKSTDEKHIEIFLKDIKSEHPIFHETRIVKGKIYHASGVNIGSQKIVQGLVEKGVCQQKSLILKWINVRSDLERHFIRGYFDGDGCFCVRKTRKECSYSFTGSPFFIPVLQEIIQSNCGLKKVSIQQRNKKSKSFFYGGIKNCRTIYHYLYDDCSVFLGRKKEKAEQFLSGYGLLSSTGVGPRDS